MHTMLTTSVCVPHIHKRVHITHDQSVSFQVAQHEARVNDLCEERDDLRCKVILLTANARRMDRDVKRLQAQYDKLCDDKRQGGDQVCTNIPLELTRNSLM